MGERVITVLASGRGSDLQSILDAIDEGLLRDVRVGLVISDNPEAYALERAREKDIPALALPPVLKREGGRREHERRIDEAIDAHKADGLIVLAGYMRIMSADFLHERPHEVVNIHPALLPAFPGSDGPGDALAYGVRLAGCTTHFVDEGIDTGAVILQGAVRVHDDDTRDSLHERILRLEHQILPRTIDLWAQDRLQVEGRRVRILPGDTWMDKVEPVPEALYPHGF